MKSFNGLFVAAIASIFLNSCSKNGTTEPSIKTEPLVLSAHIKIAKIWKNGVATSLTNGSNNAVANSVFVLGNDVYATGYEFNGTKNVAKIWKNGVATSLTDGSKAAEAVSVYVSGNDVYVAGNEYNPSTDGNKAMLWKNGIATQLTDGFGAGANSIYVNGNDVYVAGSLSKVVGQTSSPIAAMWKNGATTPLENIGVRATSIYGYNNDIYVIGEENGDYGPAKLWKNGVVSTIGIGNDISNTNATSVFVLAGNVYLCGNVVKYVHPNLMGIAAVWKNNIVTYLTDGTTRAMANSVYVSNNDIYVVGYENPGAISTQNGTGSYTVVARPNIAKLWKNGVATSLTDGTKQASANSVFVSGNDVYVAGYEAK